MDSETKIASISRTREISATVAPQVFLEDKVSVLQGAAKEVVDSDKTLDSITAPADNLLEADSKIRADSTKLQLDKNPTKTSRGTNNNSPQLDSVTDLPDNRRLEEMNRKLWLISRSLSENFG